MKRYAFDALMIVLMAILMIVVTWFHLAELYMKLALVPMLIFYFLGKYSQRKFGTADAINS